MEPVGSPTAAMEKVHGTFCLRRTAAFVVAARARRESEYFMMKSSRVVENLRV